MKIYSIKSKLLALVGLAILLLGVMIAIGLVSYSRIQKVQNNSIEKSEQARIISQEKSEQALVLRDHIQEVLSAVQRARIAEKAYLQFKQPAYIEQLKSQMQVARDELDFATQQNIDTAEMVSLIDQYEKDFSGIVELTGKIAELNTTILDEFTTMNVLIEAATKKIQGQKFNLQMTGEDLSPSEANFSAFLKQISSTINFVSAQRAQFQLYGDPAFIDDIMTYYKQKMKGEISAIVQSGRSLKDDAYVKVGEAYSTIMPLVQEQTQDTLDYFNQITETGNRLNEYGNSLAEVGRNMLEAISEDTRSAQKEAINEIDRSKREAAESIGGMKRNAAVLSLTVLIIGLSAFLAIAFIIMHSMLKPIHRTLALLQDIAQGEGDLTKRLTVSSRDEIGEMANWFNLFVEKLQNIIHSIADNTSSLTTSAGSLSSVSSQMSGATKKMTEESASVAAAGEQLSSNINTVASGAEEMSATINTVAAAIEEMGASITEVARNCEKESTLAEKANAQANQTRE
ncbi:MAG: methyl-accepting chemotaxis protein, partial [Verrucomicrobiae bacterium]|nr:methyl-accepting chemotaxis protein [Verrucomicrobiae bacterium]